MTGRVASLRRRARSDAGVSVVELAVTMVVASILLAGVGTVFIGTARGVRTMNVKTAITADVRIAMEAVSRTVRVAYQPPGETSAVVSASSTALTFYALLNRTGATSQPLPALVEYSWTGTCLMEAQTPARVLATPSASGSLYAWDTGRTSKCLLRTSTAPGFAFFTDGAATTAMASTSTLAERQSIESVQVTLTGRDAANPGVSGVPSRVRLTLQNVAAAAGG